MCCLSLSTLHTAISKSRNPRAYRTQRKLVPISTPHAWGGGSLLDLPVCVYLAPHSDGLLKVETNLVTKVFRGSWQGDDQRVVAAYCRKASVLFANDEPSARQPHVKETKDSSCFFCLRTGETRSMYRSNSTWKIPGKRRSRPPLSMRRNLSRKKNLS